MFKNQPILILVSLHLSPFPRCDAFSAVHMSLFLKCVLFNRFLCFIFLSNLKKSTFACLVIHINEWIRSANEKIPMCVSVCVYLFRSFHFFVCECYFSNIFCSLNGRIYRKFKSLSVISLVLHRTLLYIATSMWLFFRPYRLWQTRCK